MDDVSIKTNVLHPYSYLLRMLSLGIIHLGIWIIIAAVIMGTYFFSMEGNYWMLVFLVLVLAIVLIVDARKRRNIRLEFEKRLKS